ncbi:MAG: hypothetical protein ACRDY4_05595 [Acidimicrobiia bacterium]
MKLTRANSACELFAPDTECACLPSGYDTALTFGLGEQIFPRHGLPP